MNVAEKLRKLSALMNDPASTEGEKAACRAAIARLRKIPPAAGTKAKASYVRAAWNGHEFTFSGDGLTDEDALAAIQEILFGIFTAKAAGRNAPPQARPRNPGYPDPYKE